MQTKKDLILIHGWGQSANMWDNLVDDLKNDFHLHLLNLPGFGGKLLMKVYDLSDYAEYIKKFIDENKLESASVVAHSFSGRVMCEYVKKFKYNKFDKIIFYSTNFSKRITIFRIINIFLIKFLGQVCPNFIYYLNCNLFNPKNFKNKIIYDRENSKNVLKSYLSTHDLFVDLILPENLFEQSQNYFVEGSDENLLRKFSSQIPTGHYFPIARGRHFSHIYNKQDFLKTLDCVLKI